MVFNACVCVCVWSIALPRWRDVAEEMGDYLVHFGGVYECVTDHPTCDPPFEEDEANERDGWW